MIRTWTLEHFKSVFDRTTLELAPLTIFAGANNSGKSTLIQSLLLTAQTLQSPVHSRSVILNGHIVRLGTFRDILSDGLDNGKILIGFRLTALPNELERPSITQSGRRLIVGGYPFPLDGHVSVECEFSFSAYDPVESEVPQLQPRLEESVLNVRLDSEQRPVEERIRIRRAKRSIAERVTAYRISDEYSTKSGTDSLEYEVLEPTSLPAMRRYGLRFLSIQHGQQNTVGVALNHFLPSAFAVVYDAVEQEARILTEAFASPEDIYPSSYYKALLSDDSTYLNDKFKALIITVLEEAYEEQGQSAPSNQRLSAALNSLHTEFTIENVHRCYGYFSQQGKRQVTNKLSDSFAELVEAAKAERQPIYKLADVPVGDVSDIAIDYMQQFFTRQLKYLGPLRDEPKPVYPLAGAIDPKDVGFRGEHTAAVLDIHRNTIIEYVPSAKIERGDFAAKPRSVPLLTAVLDWLAYMGVASNLETIDRDKLGHELKIKTADTDELHDLTHVGVGVSQVLPILVLSLLAERNSTLIFEQPELHLHPRVQTRLADFFVSMTMLGKQCVAETHSEYLINRLRYSAASSDGDRIASSVIIYYVEKEGSYSNYRAVHMNQFGVIEDWPKGFFDESEETSAAILRASINKKKSGSRRKND